MSYKHRPVEESFKDVRIAGDICKKLYALLRSECLKVGWSPIQGYFVLRRFLMGFELVYNIDPKDVHYTTEKSHGPSDVIAGQHEPLTDPSKFN